MSNSRPTVNSFCPQADICSVCHWIEHDRAWQITEKSKRLEITLKKLRQKQNFEFIDLGPGYLRTRLDLTLSPNGNLGFYKKNTQEIFSLGHCPQLTPELLEFLGEFQKNFLPKIQQKGSLRLRTYNQKPDQIQKGVWFDFSHIDIKFLLEQKDLLMKLSKIAFVEIGQRRKALFFSDTENRFKLAEPQMHPWAQSHTSSKTIPLYGQVASFTQTGPSAEKHMGTFVSHWVSQIRPKKLHEFGPGLGTLSFAAAEHSQQWIGYENDPYSIQSLLYTIENNPEYKNKMTLLKGDFQNNRQAISTKPKDILLLNPPRSGAGNFLTSLEELPDYLIYISCFLDSFEGDFLSIHHKYNLIDCKILDQFPQSKHFEILSVWQKS